MSSATDFSSRKCTQCGYDLRGLVETRCPECGEQFDPNVLPIAPIPWLHRSSLGRWTAFWRTVFDVSLRPWKLAQHAPWNSHVPAKDAKSFAAGCRRVAVASSVVCFSAAPFGSSGLVFIMATAPFQLFFLFVASIAVESFAPPWNDLVPLDRIRVLSRFTIAPLALSAIVVLLYGVAQLVSPVGSIVIPLLWVPIAMLLWLYVLIVFYWHALNGQTGMVVVNAVLLTVIWSVLVVTLGFFAVTVGITAESVVHSIFDG